MLLTPVWAEPLLSAPELQDQCATPATENWNHGMVLVRWKYNGVALLKSWTRSKHVGTQSPNPLELVTAELREPQRPQRYDSPSLCAIWLHHLELTPLKVGRW